METDVLVLMMVVKLASIQLLAVIWSIMQH